MVSRSRETSAFQDYLPLSSTRICTFEPDNWKSTTLFLFTEPGWNFLSLAGMRRLHSRALYLIKSPAAVWAQKRPLPLYTRTNHSAAAFINANMLFANFIYRPRHRVARRAVNILPCNWCVLMPVCSLHGRASASTRTHIWPSSVNA